MANASLGLKALSCRAMIVFVGLVVFVDAVHALDRLNVRGTGMAQASVAVGRGLDAVGINPANLSLSDGGILTFTVLPTYASVSSDLFTYNFYSSYFKNRQSFTGLAEQDKRFILNAFESSLSHTRADLSTRLFGASVRVTPLGTIAFTVDYRLAASANIPREYLNLLMFGNVRNAAFSFDDMAVQSCWVRSYSLSYGTMIGAPSFLTWLSAGVGLKLVQGYGYFETEQLSASLQTGYAELLSGRVSWHSRAAGKGRFVTSFNDLFETPVGYGFGVDIGISGGVNEFLSFGVSVTDIGGIRWSDDIEKYSFEQFVFDIEPETFSSLRNLEKKFKDLKTTSGGFTSVLPGLLRAGISLQVDKALKESNFPANVLLAVDYSQGIGAETPLREKPRLSFGMEYRPLQWLPLRTGFAFRSGAKTHIAFGFGLNFRGFDLDLGTESVLMFFNPRSASYASIGIGMRFRIPTDYVAL